MPLNFPQNPQIDSTYSSNGITWRYNGKGWAPVVTGLQGVQGLQGLDGAFASQGIQGIQGVQGLDGQVGTNGLGSRTVSTASPSGGSAYDIWYQI